MWILFSRSIETAVITLPSSASARFRTVIKNTVRASVHITAHLSRGVPRYANTLFLSAKYKMTSDLYVYIGEGS